MMPKRLSALTAALTIASVAIVPPAAVAYTPPPHSVPRNTIPQCQPGYIPALAAFGGVIGGIMANSSSNRRNRGTRTAVIALGTAVGAMAGGAVSGC